MYAYKNIMYMVVLFIFNSWLAYNIISLQTLFITTPDMFVFPVCWNTYKDLLRVILVDDDSKTDPPNLKRQRERYFEAIRSRNEIFDDKKINPLGMSNARDALDSRMISVRDFLLFISFIIYILNLFGLLKCLLYITRF